MPGKKKKKRIAIPFTQLCLFSDEQMITMVENPEPVKAVIPGTADPEHLRWQLEIGANLKGAAGRQHRKMYNRSKGKSKIAYDKHVDLTAEAVKACLNDAGESGENGAFEYVMSSLL